MTMSHLEGVGGGRCHDHVTFGGGRCCDQVPSAGGRCCDQDPSGGGRCHDHVQSGGGRCCDQVRSGGGGVVTRSNLEGGRCCDQVPSGGGEVLWPDHLPPSDGQTNACENITFTRFAMRAVKMGNIWEYKVGNKPQMPKWSTLGKPRI